MENWYKITICRACGIELSRSQEMDGSGICAHCGHDSQCTICDTKTVIVKAIKNKWWKFRKPKKYIGKDNFSQNWINNFLK